MPQQPSIPLYTKIGGRITMIIALLLTVLIVKRCAGSIYYGAVTPQSEIEKLYNSGYRDGSGQASDIPAPSPAFDNPLLKKSYQKGFRDGWDQQHLQAPSRSQ